MLAQQVSPPDGGSSTARSTAPMAGSGLPDESLCQSSVPSPTGLVTSSTTMAGWSGWLVA